MLGRLQGFGVALFSAMLASAACSDSESNGSGGGGKNSQSGEGGESPSGGKGGQSGGAGKGGSGGKVSVMGGAGGAGGAEEPACPGCASGFCLEDGTCVDCLATDDQCPLGQYCTDANACIAGCKDDTLGTGGATDAAPDCASGICGADHNCKNCISDDECTGDDVCNNGECGAACTAGQEGQQAGCGTDLTCCSLHCVELQTDANHCGSCGAGCEADQFCGKSSCDGGSGGAGGDGAGGAGSGPCVSCYDVTLANVCSIGKVIVILDTTVNANEGNRIPGRAIGAALGAQCNPAPEVTEEEQDSVDALNFTTGRPVSGGGELLLVAGGPFFQQLEGYVEEQGISPLYLKVDVNANTQEFLKRSDDSVVVGRTIDGDNLQHDFFIIQFMRDPQSGSLVLNAQGFWLSGTTAASFMMLNGILPALSTYDKAWYAYEWTDGNGDFAPQLGEIVLQDSGP